MKAATILIMLILTTAVLMGCTTTTTQTSSQGQISEEQAIADIDNSVIDMDSEVVIGEMIT